MCKPINVCSELHGLLPHTKVPIRADLLHKVLVLVLVIELTTDNRPSTVFSILPPTTDYRRFQDFK